MANNETKLGKEKGQYMALEQRDAEKQGNEDDNQKNLVNKDEEQHLKEEPGKEQEDKEGETLEDEFDLDFWVEVRKQREADNTKSWNQAMDRVRVSRLIDKYNKSGEQPSQDPFLVMLKKWPQHKSFKDEFSDRLLVLEQEVDRFAKILLEDSEMNADNRYETFRDKSEKDHKTLLHYAAELNFLHVTKSLVKKCPGLMGLKTKALLKPEKKRGLLPVEVALLKEKDDVAAYLIGQMSHVRVQSLFSWTPGEKPRGGFFSYQEVIQNPNLKKTVVAVLNKMVNPYWPYLPECKEGYLDPEERAEVEVAWKSISSDPLEYHFYYHILDADECGRPPMIQRGGPADLMANEHFDQKSKSCLHVIAKSDNRLAIQHPVVRMLITTKWKAYGHKILCLQALFYALFLLVLSYALIYGSTRSDPKVYSSSGDYLRGVCEFLTLVFALYHVCEEVNQIVQDTCQYFKDFYNLFDWLGLLFVFLLVPLRFRERQEQWTIASLAYLFNWLRIFKFSCVTRTTGLYTKTLTKIIRQDISRFLTVFAFVFLSFCGALFLALKGSEAQKDFSGFELVLLSGFRALVEQQPIADDYGNFRWLSVLLMLTYMGTVIVVLINILIAQLSSTYGQAKKIAKLQYDVDRILLLSRMEGYPLLNLRAKFYKEGDYISEVKLAKELLEYSEDRHPWETIEEKLNAIRGMMKEVVKQIRLPLED